MKAKHDETKKSKSPGQLTLENITAGAPKWNPAHTPVALETEHGTIAANETGLHFKPRGGRCLYSVPWEQVTRMFQLECLASNPHAAVFRNAALQGNGK